MKDKIVFMTGAGISKESGIATFRDSNDGLWNNYKIEEVSSIEGWKKNPSLVLDFYNQRRREILTATPNLAHIGIAELEKDFDVTIITQNVDNLHERAGSTNVIHLHGEIMKAREEDLDCLSFTKKSKSIVWDKDLHIGDYSEDGIQLRPDIVWFGEFVKEYTSAIRAVSEADVYIIVGTSLAVHPASSLHSYLSVESMGIIVDPNMNQQIPGFIHAETTATEGINIIKEILSMYKGK